VIASNPRGSIYSCVDTLWRCYSLQMQLVQKLRYVSTTPDTTRSHSAPFCLRPLRRAPPERQASAADGEAWSKTGRTGRLRHAPVRQPLPVGSSYAERGLPASHTRTAVNTVFGRGYKNRFPVYTSRPSTVTRSSPSFPRCVSTCVSSPSSCAATRAAMEALTGQTGQ
jgi:hypothetical protein